MTERQSARMSKIKNGGLDQYGAKPYEQQEFGTAGVELVKTPAVPNCCCSKGPAPYWSNPPFLIFDIRALWRSVLGARAPECQKLKWWVRPVWQSVKP